MATDINVSRARRTPAGDRIKVIRTTADSAIVTGVGIRPIENLDTIIVTGPPGVVQNETTGENAASLWDAATEALKLLNKFFDDKKPNGGGGNENGGGGGGNGKKCTSTSTVIKYGPDGKVQSFEIKTQTCEPA